MLLREECGGTHSLYSHIIIKLTKSLAMCKNFYKGQLKKIQEKVSVTSNSMKVLCFLNKIKTNVTFVFAFLQER